MATQTHPVAERGATQCERILELLSDGRWHGVEEIVRLGILGWAGRKNELKKRGYKIATRLRWRHNPKTGEREYYAGDWRLEELDGKPLPEVDPWRGIDVIVER